MRMFAQDRAFYRGVRVDETDDPKAVTAFGVTRSTYYEWRKRLLEVGVKGLVPRSSKPKSHRCRRWTAADERRVVALRREMPWAGKVRIALELAAKWPEHALSEATVGRILRRMVKAGRVCPCSF